MARIKNIWQCFSWRRMNTWLFTASKKPITVQWNNAICIVHDTKMIRSHCYDTSFIMPAAFVLLFSPFVYWSTIRTSLALPLTHTHKLIQYLKVINAFFFRWIFFTLCFRFAGRCFRPAENKMKSSSRAFHRIFQSENAARAGEKGWRAETSDGLERRCTRWRWMDLLNWRLSRTGKLPHSKYYFNHYIFCSSAGSLIAFNEKFEALIFIYNHCSMKWVSFFVCAQKRT